MTTSRRRILAGCGGLALSLTAGCAWIERDEHATVDRQYDSDSIGALAIEDTVGSVSVTTGSTLRVHGEKLAASDDAIDALSLSERREGDRLVLETSVGDGPWPTGWWRQPRFDLEIEVPENVQVARAETANGDVEIQSVDGPVAANTATGDVYVSDVQGTVDARTDAGSVIVRDVDAPISARSETGPITVDGVVQDIRTDAGAVEATVRELQGEPSIVSEAGDVSLAVESHLDVQIEVTADSGRLRTHGDGFADVDRSNSGGTVVVGDGDDRIEVSTASGVVSVMTL